MFPIISTLITFLLLPNLAKPQNFTNPILWQDLADTDIIRVGSTYYYSSSTMHYSPGAPILQSTDLINWSYIGHSVPVLDYSPAYDLASGEQAYVQGIWASFLNYGLKSSLFYWGGCVRGVGTFIYTAPDARGPWKKYGPLDNGACYYDAGSLIEYPEDSDEEIMYIAHGNTQISVSQLSFNATTSTFQEIQTQLVFTTPAEIGALEGSRFYKRNGRYYIFVTRPPDGQYILQSTTGPFGPYEVRNVVDKIQSPVPGTGSPHQGGLVETEKGDWYYMAFVDAYPGGRIPVLAPVRWDDEGWVHLDGDEDTWEVSYPYPDISLSSEEGGSSTTAAAPGIGRDYFPPGDLSPEWEWNHNPDNTKWSIKPEGGLRLSTATITEDLYRARNTLTKRMQGPSSTATIELEYSSMQDGDRAGLCLLRNKSIWIGLKRDGSTTKIIIQRNITMADDGTWNTIDTGSEDAEAIDITSSETTQQKIWFRVSANISPLTTGSNANFSYSLDGGVFESLGEGFVMDKTWPFFMGYRFGIFNYATSGIGGQVGVNWFEVSTP